MNGNKGRFMMESKFTEEEIKKYDEWLESNDTDKLLQLVNLRYRLDKLVSNKNYIVRRHVALVPYGLEELSHDESPVVRAAVASKGFNLGFLKDDPSYMVRFEVAKRGYFIDQLKNDSNYGVRFEANQH